MAGELDVLETIRQACDRDVLPYGVYVAVAALAEAAERAADDDSTGIDHQLRLNVALAGMDSAA